MERENEIRLQIEKTEEIYQKKKNKILLRILIGLSVVFYVFGFMNGRMDSIKDFLIGIPIVLVCSGICLLFSIIILTPLLNCREDEIKRIANLKAELNRLEWGSSNE